MKTLQKPTKSEIPEDATHFLECSHCIGRNGKTYFMPCKILKDMGDGRWKIKVWGDRYWLDTYHLSRIRYVNKNRVEEI